MAPKKGKDKKVVKDKGKPKGAAAKAMESTTPAKPKKIPPPPACFNADDLLKIREMFKAYDEEKIEMLPLPLIPFLLRKLGFNPKTAEIQAINERILEDEYVDTVQCHEWLQMVEAKLMIGDDLELDVFKAFATLVHDDEETGVCQMEDLKEALFTWGEPLTDIEFVDFIKLASKDKTYNIADGTFLYTKFIENMNENDERFVKEPVNFFKLDQKTLAEMAIRKLAEEKEEQAKKEAEKIARLEAKRQKLIAKGLLPPD